MQAGCPHPVPCQFNFPGTPRGHGASICLFLPIVVPAEPAAVTLQQIISKRPAESGRETRVIARSIDWRLGIEILIKAGFPIEVLRELQAKIGGKVKRAGKIAGWS
jgi:hypothetical protein